MLRIINFVAESNINILKLSLTGCAAPSALSDHVLYYWAYTAYAQMTPPEFAMLQYGCSSCCCPHAACTPLVFILC